MATRIFTDAMNRRWSITCSRAMRDRVRRAAGVNVEDVLGLVTVYRLTADLYLLAEVLYAACRDQADAAGIDQAGFDGGMTGTVMEEGLRAMQYALADRLPVGERGRGYAVAERLMAV
jgi:hypothetical protein